MRMFCVALGVLWTSLAWAQESSCTLTSAKDYLYSLYERGPKIDHYGYFGWKDDVAALRAGKTLKEYSIECLSPELQERAARFLFSAEVRGYRPAINSAYRDDFRQGMIGKGFKAKVGHSYHGGSRNARGCEHGMALDVVDEHATSSNDKERLAVSAPLWKYFDKNATVFGLKRPYGARDPSHLSLISAGEHGRAAKARRHIVHHSKKRPHVALYTTPAGI